MKGGWFSNIIGSNWYKNGSGMEHWEINMDIENMRKFSSNEPVKM
jgi:hypothetical protein